MRWWIRVDIFLTGMHFQHCRYAHLLISNQRVETYAPVTGLLGRPDKDMHHGYSLGLEKQS